MTSFSIVARSFSPNRGETDHVFLERDSWDDYGFRTLFHATYSTASGELVKLGRVKIIKRGMSLGPVDLVTTFDELKDDYCSLGQEQSFYETMRSLPHGTGYRVLESLRDVVLSQAILEAFRSEEAFQASLTRSVDISAIIRFRRLMLGEHQQTSFNFTYRFGSQTQGDAALDFVVEPNSLPPTNVHAVIGRNGVGKTTLLGRMAEAVCLSDSALQMRSEVGSFSYLLDNEGAAGNFANVVSISFSAFDDFPVPSGTGKEQLDTRYDYVGLRTFEGNRLKSQPELIDEFLSSVELCIRSSRFPFWKRAIDTLSSDPGFENLQLRSLYDSPNESFVEVCRTIYLSASAGHRLVLLTMAKLVETVGDRTLVLFDEPEAHLHPPLLGSLVRALSELLLARNGVAIVATHSPVVLQELPAKCAYILTRDGNAIAASRPSLETFGESVGILTHEVFGLEVKRSGHHALINHLVGNLDPDATYEIVHQLFDGQLGSEASSIVLALLSQNKDKR